MNAHVPRGGPRFRERELTHQQMKSLARSLDIAPMRIEDIGDVLRV
jgi:hypothetical protein